MRAVWLGQVTEHPLRDVLAEIGGNAGVDHALEERGRGLEHGDLPTALRLTLDGERRSRRLTVFHFEALISDSLPDQYRTNGQHASAHVASDRIPRDPVRANGCPTLHD